jgi:zinc transporter ZupT
MVIALALLFVTALASGVLFFTLSHSQTALKYIAVFGGAFLLAVCFVEMLPEIFGTMKGVAAQKNTILYSAFILTGFLLQLLLELISKGAEHGHLHTNSNLMPLMIFLGVSLHAFLEGFALISNGEINKDLLIGVILHNIPVSVVIVSSFTDSGASKKKALLMLSIFAIMGVLGSLLNYRLQITQYEPFILSFVVGILLHVSVSTLFDNRESHNYNLLRFLIVVSAFALVFLLPV